MYLTRTFQIGKRLDAVFEFEHGCLSMRWEPEPPACFDQWTLEDLAIARAEFLGLLAATFGRASVVGLAWEGDDHP